jgi:hypothetical protein
MRPLDFFSIAAANCFSHSCCPSLSVGVASFITIGLFWAWRAGTFAAKIAVAAITASEAQYPDFMWPSRIVPWQRKITALARGG